MAAPAATGASACRDWPACRTAGVRTPGALTAKAAARVEARGVAQLLVELLLPLGERPGQHDAEIGVEVAGAAVRLGQPLAAERHVPRAAKAAAAPASECAERLEQVGQVDAAEVLAGVAAEALVPVGRRTEVLPRAVRAEAVEGGALFLVPQGLVRLGHFL